MIRFRMLDKIPRPMKLRFLASLLCLIPAALAFSLPQWKLPVLDRAAGAYFRQAITTAGAAYAACRLVNAGVSVIKHSAVEAEPFGLGLSLAAGEAADPIDDMTERTADVLVAAIVALGVEKLLFEISVLATPRATAGLLAVFTVFLWMKFPWAVRFRRQILQLLILVMIARFSLPLSAGVNAALDHAVFEPKISRAKARLGILSGFDRLFEFKIQGNGDLDFFDRLRRSASLVHQKTGQLKAAFRKTLENAAAIIQNLLILISMYAAVIGIETLALPLLLFWGLWKTASACLEPPLPPPWAEQKHKS